MNKDHFEVEECFVGVNRTSPMTNGDCIRAMSDEELAETFIAVARGLLNGLGMNGSIAEEKAKSDEIRKARQRDLTYDKEIRDVQYHGLKRRR